MEWESLEAPSLQLMGNFTLHSPLVCMGSSPVKPGASREGVWTTGDGGDSVLSRHMRGGTSARSASLSWSCCLSPCLSSVFFKPINRRAMGIWSLLLLLLFLTDGALSLPGEHPPYTLLIYPSSGALTDQKRGEEGDKRRDRR